MSGAPTFGRVSRERARAAMGDPRGPFALLGAAMLAGAALLLWEMREHSLLFDEWSFLADYRGRSLSVLASPFGDNLLLVPIVLYKLVFAAFGPDSVALDLLLVALNLTCAALFFELMRRRVDAWIAALAAILLIFLGAASDVVAATLGIAILLTSACGLGALLALEREDPPGDLIAAALLSIALASNTLAVPFLVGAAVRVALVDRRPLWPRAWLVAGPALAYGAWRLWALGVDPVGPLAAHPSEVTLVNVGTLTTSVLDSLAAAALTITGLFTEPGSPGSFSDTLGPVLAVALLVALGARLHLGPPVRREALVFAAMPLTYWALIGLVALDRLPHVSRYQYAGAIFLALLAAELARDLRPSRTVRLAVAATLVVALLPNLAKLHENSRFIREGAHLNRAALAAIEITRDRVDPNLLIEPLGARLDPEAPALFTGGEPDLHSDVLISARAYISARYAFGSAAYTEDELSSATAAAREHADRELAVALGISAAPAPSARSPAGSGDCTRLVAGEEVELPPGGALVRAGAEPATPRLRRFADDHVVELAPVAAGTTASIAIQTDHSDRPWRLEPSQGVVVCPRQQPASGAPGGG